MRLNEYFKHSITPIDFERKLKRNREAIMQIEIPDFEDPKVKKIRFDTLMKDFSAIFMEPRITEIYYKIISGGWRISFIKNGVIICCDALFDDIVNYLSGGRPVSEDEYKNLIVGWQNQYLIKAIQEA